MGYPKEVYEHAWAVLDQRRQSAQQLKMQNQQMALREIPQIADIQRKMVYIGAGISKSILANPAEARQWIEQLAAENLALQEERASLLAAHGYPRDYLEEHYTCPHCKDTGYIGTEICDCFRDLLRQQAFALLNEVSEQNRRQFAEFDTRYYATHANSQGVVPRQRMEEILEFCKLYAQTFSQNSPSLLLMGKTGLGKTHLSLAIAWEITQRGFGIVYTPVQKVLDRLESDKFSYNPDAKARYAQNMESLLQCDLLILDDLGTEFATSFTKSVLYNLINTRLVEGRPTMINTNLELSEIEGMYSQRIASRLGFSYKILRFEGEDVRYQKRTAHLHQK